LFTRAGNPGWIPGASSRRVGSVTEQHSSIRSIQIGVPPVRSSRRTKVEIEDSPHIPLEITAYCARLRAKKRPDFLY